MDSKKAFNKISTVEFMVDELNEAVSRNDTEQIVDIKCIDDISSCISSHYEKASRRAWNNTVAKVAESDVPYRNDTESGNEDIIAFKYNAETDDMEAPMTLPKDRKLKTQDMSQFIERLMNLTSDPFILIRWKSGQEHLVRKLKK